MLKNHLSILTLSNDTNGIDSIVTLPVGHQAVLHVCRDYKRKDGRFGQYLLIVCVDLTNTPYILYHQFNSLQQITFGFYVSPDGFEPKEPLQCDSRNNQIKCLKYMQQVMTMEPIGDMHWLIMVYHHYNQTHCKDTHL